MAEPVAESATCSALSARDEPLAGTAAQVRRWLCIEHNGPWGRDAIAGEALGAEVSAQLGLAARQADVRVMLIRRSGRRVPSQSFQVYLASSEFGWCTRISVADYDELNRIDLSALALPEPSLGEEVTVPVVLVCTHGRRDQCCARLGRPLAASLAEAYSELVWECSHTGGHRFAPSLIVLPSGYTYGRLTAGQAGEVVAAATRGEVAQVGLRGRSTQTARSQVAELAVRALLPSFSGECVVVESADSVLVTASGRRWHVQTEVVPLPPRALSCGADSASVDAVRVASISEQ